MMEVQLSPTEVNALCLAADLRWFAQVLNARIQSHTNEEQSPFSIFDIPPPALEQEGALYASLVRHYEMQVPERLVFLLVLIPHLKPELLDPFFMANRNLHRGYTEFGGIKGNLHGGFIPTGETAMFLLSGGDLYWRLEFEFLFSGDHYFARHNLIKMEQAPFLEPRLSGPLFLSKEVIDLLTTGEVQKPGFSRDFPAKLLETNMLWSDLILDNQTREQLKELDAWMHHEQELMVDWGMQRKLKPGYKSLFYGPPGTGKTLTATLFGKRYRKDVYRIDLSSVISKYIGETEKNLERIFERTEYGDAILFFDEADAIFGKRTTVSDSHDRYANQEVSYLLQRIEDYPGLVVLASNFKSNIDDAFIRRFQSIVHFPMPGQAERLRLWQQAFSEKAILEESIDLVHLANKYKLSGGAIINVVRYTSLMALQRGEQLIRSADLINGIRREFQKEGKSM
ncbi:MAG: ATP-binding protein [Bacteroidota bacterium]